MEAAGNVSGGDPTTQNDTMTDGADDTHDLEAWVRTFYMYTVPPMLFLCMLTFIVNLVIVASSRWIRRPLSPTISISISLAMADAYAALVVAIGLAINSLLPVVFRVSMGDNLICYVLVLEAFRLGGIISSIAHLTALAVNHYIGILRPLHYASTMTPRTTTMVIGLLWVLPIAFFFVYFSSMPDMGFRSPHCAYKFITYKKFRYVVFSMFFAPLLIMGAIYCHIFIIVRRHQASRRRFQNSNQLARSVKAVKTTVMIMGTYVVGWMPAVLVFCLVCEDCVYHFNAGSPITMRCIYTTINFLYILKTLVDPIIYAARMHEIKLALRKMRFSACGGADNDTRPSSELSQQRVSTYASRRAPERIALATNGSFDSSKPSSSCRTATIMQSKSTFRSSDDNNGSLV